MDCFLMDFQLICRFLGRTQALFRRERRSDRVLGFVQSFPLEVAMDKGIHLEKPRHSWVVGSRNRGHVAERKTT